MFATSQRGLIRGLGRDTAANVAAWPALIARTAVAPRLFAAGTTPDHSPNVRRFHYDSFQDQRSRGFCVGFNFTGTVKTRLRIPVGATETTGDPLPEVNLSPLYGYATMRLECLKDGIPITDRWGRVCDGGIGSEAAKAASTYGLCLETDYPSGPKQTDSFSNGASPPKVDLTYGAAHVVVDYALAEDFEHGLSLNAAGYPLSIESDIPESMMDCDSKGFFRMRGGIAGGHNYQLLDHDKSKNTATIAQSWAQWGEPTSDPKYANRGGYTQIGTCPLDDLAAWFSDRAMANGESAMIVINTVAGFDSPLISWGDAA